MLYNLSKVPRDLKKFLIIVFDLICVFTALTLAVALRMGDFFSLGMLAQSLPLYPVMGALGITLALALRIPNIRLSAFDQDAIVKNGLAALLLATLSTILNWAFELGAPRTVPMIASLMFLTLSVGGRMAILRLLQWFGSRKHSKLPVAIYGAGSAGLQLLSALKQANEFRPVAIVDDNPAMLGVIIGGLTVQTPKTLPDLAARKKVARILIAMPSIPMARRTAIAKELAKLTVGVQIMPSQAEIINDGGLIQALRPISSDNLLGRSTVDLDIPEIDRTYAGRTVLITGAGGSIGSELCRQILHLKAHRIVLYELSEFALYTIERQLRGLLGENSWTEIHPVLGSVTDRARLDEVLASFDVDILLHAAAYKHVPLIEMNEVEGVRNNVHGTQCVAEAAVEAEIERFILVSTDKAVRPTNVMGATKRIAEMIIQDLQTRHALPRFAIVRFGNVLDSTGSVVPLFREQIAAGGPVTLTHSEVTRFFMTLSEAARLVILASAYANDGSTFVLDMGRPVKIADLARQMIELSGLTVRDEANPHGNIEINVMGLRPGEKLYEELLIDENMLKTPHSKIMRAEEAFPSQIEMAGLLRELRSAVETQSPEAVRNAIGKSVEGYQDYKEASKWLKKSG